MALGAASLPAALFLLLPLSLLLSVKEADIDPLSPVPWASASPTAAFRLHLLKAATLLSTHLLSGFSRALAASLSAAFLVWAAFIEVARLPYFGTVHSAVRAAVQGAIAVMFSVAALRDRWGSYHLVAAIGAPFVGLLCGSLAVIRLRHARRVVGRYFALRDDVAPASKRHHRFYDEEEPEVRKAVRSSGSI